MQRKSLTKFNIYFYSLIAVSRNSKTMLNNSGKNGHLCLITHLRGNAFSFSPLRIMFPLSFSYIASIMLRYIPYFPAFWRVFIINKC